MFPWILKFTFRGTNFTLRLLGRALLYPMATCLGSVFFGELALRLVAPERILPQLLVVALGFTAAYLCSALVPSVRNEIISFKSMLSELRLSSRVKSPTV